MPKCHLRSTAEKRSIVSLRAASCFCRKVKPARLVQGRFWNPLTFISGPIGSLLVKRQSTIEPLVAHDPVLEHLTRAVVQADLEGLPRSAAFVDPIARAIATRLLLLAQPGAKELGRPGGLSVQQLREVQAFVRANIEREIGVKATAESCGLGSKGFTPRIQEVRRTVAMSA
jgi:hypothetical protein